MDYFYLVIECLDMLRSILTQMEYQYRVCEWDQKCVPFRTYMYVLEIHHITQKPFLEREDEGHVFKVCVLLYMHVLCITIQHVI